MLTSDGNKHAGKSGHRKEKPAQAGRKAEQRKRKAAAKPDTRPEQPQAAPEKPVAPLVSAESTEAPAAVSSEALSATSSEPLATISEEAPSTASEGSSVEESLIEESSVLPAVDSEAAPVSYRTIADAWGNYSKTSLEQTRSYFEKLAGVRSLGGALEVQAEFARQACETFVTESQKIRELHGELAKQRLKNLEGFMAKVTKSAQGR